MVKRKQNFFCQVMMQECFVVMCACMICVEWSEVVVSSCERQHLWESGGERKTVILVKFLRKYFC
jgi:hypothetical protein